MSKKKLCVGLGAVLVWILLNICIFSYHVPVNTQCQLNMKVEGEQKSIVQVYYRLNGEFTETNSAVQSYEGGGTEQELSFPVSSEADAFRIDFGDQPGASYTVSDICFAAEGQKMEKWTWELENPIEKLQVSYQADSGEGSFLAETEGTDPHVIFQAEAGDLRGVMEEAAQKENFWKNCILGLLLNGGAVLVILFRKKFFELPRELYQNRRLIMNLSKNDFKTKYAGSYLGIVWAFIQPIVTILVYCFVFTVGFRSGDVANYPFVLYLISGMVPWLFFQDALNGGTNSLIEYSYLVKKVVFKISILPIVKIISALFVHLFFIAFSLVVFSLYGYTPTIYTVQILYYSACTFLFSLALVYATSAIVIFFRDLTQIINIVLQVGVWMTPIMWDLNMLSNHPLLMKLFKFNPMYYIVNGYRDSMLAQVWAIERWKWGLYFWVVTGLLFLLGAVIFKKLKIHFADVL